MKRYRPVPREEVLAWAERFAKKSLEEVIAMLGAPVREHGPSQYERHFAGKTIEITRITKTFEFSDVSASVHTLLVDMREDGKLEYRFQGRELTETKR